MRFFELKNLKKDKDTVVARWAKMLIVLLLVTLLFLIPTFITVIHLSLIHIDAADEL